MFVPASLLNPVAPFGPTISYGYHCPDGGVPAGVIFAAIEASCCHRLPDGLVTMPRSVTDGLSTEPYAHAPGPTPGTAPRLMPTQVDVCSVLNGFEWYLRSSFEQNS